MNGAAPTVGDNIRYSKTFEKFIATLPSMKGKTIAITGTTSGIGYVCAKEAVRTGGKVIVLNRASQRAVNTLSWLEAYCADGGSVQQVVCDLTKLRSVSEAAEAVRKACNGRLDALVCNAGIMASPDQKTADGYDIQMQANHLGHWLLIRKLTPVLDSTATANGEARIVLHTSGQAFKMPDKATGKLKPLDAMYFGKDAFIGDAAGDSMKARMRRYQQSKLAMIVAGIALAEELLGRKSAIKVLIAHPGMAATSLFTKEGGFKMKILMPVLRMIAATMEEGAMPLMTCVFCSEPTASGDFWGPKNRLKGPPVMCGAPEHLLKERGPDAWNLIHGDQSKKLCIELSDLASRMYL